MRQQMDKFSLPQSWAQARLEDCVDILDAMRIPVNNDERQLRINGKSESELFPYYGATGEVGKIDGYIFDEELIALGEDGVPFFDSQKNKAYLINGKTWVNNHAHVIRAIRQVTANKFILHYLNQFDYQGYVNGGTRLKLTQANMRRIPVALPSLDEQQQIAAKLDELLAQVDSIKTRLDAIPKILKRFRQSLLAAAVSGKLTEEWRTINQIKNWKTIELRELKIDVQIGPFGSLLHKSDYVEAGVPLVNPMHISDGQIITSASMTISREKARELDRYTLKRGDIVLGRRGEMGRAAVVNNDGLICGTGSLFLRPNLQYFQPEFVCFVLSATETIKFLVENSVGTTMVNLNQGVLNKLPFPQVGLEEQTEIVRRVEQLFTYAEQIEQRVKDAQARVNYLTQAILAKAFRGELTADWREQNSDLIKGDNSAEALLKRIQLVRNALVTGKATKVKKKSSEPMTQKQIIPVYEALQAAGKPLSGQELLASSGYPNDASTQQLEKFFLDIRQQLELKTITRTRRDNSDQDWFQVNTSEG